MHSRDLSLRPRRPDLPRLQRDDAGRSAGGGGGGRRPAEQLGQPLERARVQRAGARRDGRGARTARGAARLRGGRARLHRRGLGKRQPGDQGDRLREPRARRPPGHERGRAPGGAERMPLAGGAARVPPDHPAGRRHRPGGPGRASARGRAGHGARERDARQQRGGHAQPDRRARRGLPRARRPVPHRRGAVGRQGANTRRRARRRPADGRGAQAVRAEGDRRAVRPARHAARLAGARRWPRGRAPRRDRERAVRRRARARRRAVPGDAPRRRRAAARAARPAARGARRARAGPRAERSPDRAAAEHAQRVVPTRGRRRAAGSHPGRRGVDRLGMPRGADRPVVGAAGDGHHAGAGARRGAAHARTLVDRGRGRPRGGAARRELASPGRLRRTPGYIRRAVTNAVLSRGEGMGEGVHPSTPRPKPHLASDQPLEGLDPRSVLRSQCTEPCQGTGRRHMERRRFLLGSGAALAALLAACGGAPASPPPKLATRAARPSPQASGASPTTAATTAVANPPTATALPPAQTPTSAALVPTPTPTQTAAGRVVVVLGQQPDTLMPRLGSAMARAEVLGALHVEPVRADDKGSWVAMGVESVPTIENGGARWVGDGDDRHLEVTFKVRKGLKWHDGQPVTAADMRFHWSVVMNPKFGADDRTAEKKVNAVDVLDDQTAVYKYHSARQARDAAARGFMGLPPDEFKDWRDAKDPIVDALFMTVGGFLPEHILGKLDPGAVGSDFGRKPVLAGPYRFKEWVPDQTITLEAVPDHPLGAPSIGTVVFRIMRDPSAQIAALQAGEVDVLTQVQGPDVDRAPELDRFQVQGSYKVYYVP